MSLENAVQESDIPAGSLKSVGSVVDIPPVGGARFSSAKIIHDSNPTTGNSTEKLMTSLLFAIPLPNPTNGYSLTHQAVQPVFLYTLPRSVYEKPTKDPLTGKRPKEKPGKKISRRWNKSIQDGEDIKRGDRISPSLMGKCVGALFRWSAGSLRFITTCDNQMLARLPPVEKLGQIQIVCMGYPTTSDDLNEADGRAGTTSPGELAEEIFLRDIFRTKKETTIRIVLSGILLPIALAAEIFAPLVFEIALIYFLVQYRGWKKIKFLLKKYQKEQDLSPLTGNHSESENTEIKKSTCGIFEFKVSELEICQQISKLTYNACSKVDPRKFPVVQDAEINSHALSNHQGATEMKTIFPYESNPKNNIDPDIMKQPPVVDRRDSINPAQISSTKDAISIKLQYNEQNTVALDTAQSICDEARGTAVTAGVTHNLYQQVAPAGEPCTLDEAKMDKNNLIFSTTITENDTKSKENLADNLPSLQKKNQPKHIANLEIAVGLIKFFKESLPPNIVARHELNERRVAEDFNRALRRRIKEYVTSIKARA